MHVFVWLRILCWKIRLHVELQQARMHLTVFAYFTLMSSLHVRQTVGNSCFLSHCLSDIQACGGLVTHKQGRKEEHQRKFYVCICRMFVLPVQAEINGRQP